MRIVGDKLTKSKIVPSVIEQSQNTEHKLDIKSQFKRSVG